MLLPAVVRWNAPVSSARYAERVQLANLNARAAVEDSAESLAQRLEELAKAGGLLRTLGGVGVPLSDLSMLAEEAAEQWTGRFNPRPFDSKDALEVYQCAF